MIALGPLGRRRLYNFRAMEAKELLERGDATQAKARVEAILRVSPDHDMANELLERLKR